MKKLSAMCLLLIIFPLLACNGAADNTSNPAVQQPTVTAGQPVAAAPTVVGTVSPDEADAKIDLTLKQQIQSDPSAKNIEFLVHLVEQVEPGSNLSPQEAEAYFQRQQEVANRTQPAVEANLKSLQASGEVQSYNALIVTNAFAVVGSPNAIRVLAARRDVAMLYGNVKPLPLEDPLPTPSITPQQPYFSLLV